MGVTNLAKLIQPILGPSSTPDNFDSVLVDCQSYLYTAIEHFLETEDDDIFDEICESVWKDIKKLLTSFCSYTSNYLTFILSFDGEGVPMKWATQRDRRNQKKCISKKVFYRYILFGSNKLSSQVENYLKCKIKECFHPMKVVICGCNVPGEGEHKIFQVAEALKNCQNPIVVSVDQDVFILAFLRLQRYESIQIYRYNHFYNITRFASKNLHYPLKRLTDASFLFGNDFIPTLIGITTTNPPTIHKCLSLIDENDDDPPAIIASFIQNMQKNIRFTVVEYIDPNLIICFWMTYFWILDYYTTRHFPQQFLENRVFDAFNRNQLITGLADETFSRENYKTAKENYQCLITQPIPNAEQHVFIDSKDLLKQLESYWIKSKSQHCTILRITNSNCKKRKLPKCQSDDIETSREMGKT